MLHRYRVEREYQPLYKSDKLGLTTWSPLCSGILTGKYNNGIPDDSRLNVKGFYSNLKNTIIDENGKYGKWEDVVEKSKQLKVIADDLNCTHIFFLKVLYI